MGRDTVESKLKLGPFPQGITKGRIGPETN